jgi:hypothetical protein
VRLEEVPVVEIGMEGGKRVPGSGEQPRSARCAFLRAAHCRARTLCIAHCCSPMQMLRHRGRHLFGRHAGCPEQRTSAAMAPDANSKGKLPAVIF